jgi:uncharacterized protein YozE (UPF0346 family)
MAKLAEEYCTKALGEYAELGFTAHEDDDHFLVVCHYGEEIARYNATTVKFDEVLKDCHQHYNEDVLLGHALEG